VDYHSSVRNGNRYFEKVPVPLNKVFHDRGKIRNHKKKDPYYFFRSCLDLFENHYYDSFLSSPLPLSKRRGGKSFSWVRRTPTEEKDLG
jgi:hypothetical protein